MNEQKTETSLKLIQTGQVAKGLKLGREALTENPTDRNIHYTLGYGYRQDKQLEKSEFHFRKAIALKPDDNFSQLGLGITLQMQEKFDEAISAIKEAIRLDQYFQDAYNSLGFTYSLKGDTKKAIETYLEGINIIFLKIFHNLLNPANHEYVFSDQVADKFKHEHWIENATRFMTQSAAEDGIDKMQFPTRETAVQLEKKNTYGNRMYIDEEKTRKILPNFFNNIADKLSWNIFYSTFMSNIGAAYARRGEDKLARQYFLESIAFIPPNTEYLPPFFGLQNLDE